MQRSSSCGWRCGIQDARQFSSHCLRQAFVSVSSQVAVTGWRLRRTAAALVLSIVIVGIGGGAVISAAYAAKIPPIAAPMYDSAFASLITGHPSRAVRVLRHLARADPEMADVQNALALALFSSDASDDQGLALEHARRAVSLAPGVPQFVVTAILTDRRQWRIDPDGTTRLTHAALKLAQAASELARMKGKSAKKLARILGVLRKTGTDPNYPFEMDHYAKLVANPKLALTRPKRDAFGRAQESLVEKIRELRKKLNAEKRRTENDKRAAQAHKRAVDQQLAEATKRLKTIAGAKARALRRLQLAEATVRAEYVAEIKPQNVGNGGANDVRP